MLNYYNMNGFLFTLAVWRASELKVIGDSGETVVGRCLTAEDTRAEVDAFCSRLGDEPCLLLGEATLGADDDGDFAILFPVVLESRT